VVKDVLRVRKDQVAEQQTVEANLRKEDVEIAQDGDVVAGSDT
jgi:stress response protein YsnF